MIYGVKWVCWCSWTRQVVVAGGPVASVSPAPAQCCQISRAHAHRRRFNFAPTQRSRRAAALLACRARSLGRLRFFPRFALLRPPLPPQKVLRPLNYNFIANETIAAPRAFTRWCPRMRGRSRVSRASRAFRFSPDRTRGVSNLKTTVGAVVPLGRTQDLYNRSKKRENKYSNKTNAAVSWFCVFFSLPPPLKENRLVGLGYVYLCEAPGFWGVSMHTLLGNRLHNYFTHIPGSMFWDSCLVHPYFCTRVKWFTVDKLCRPVHVPHLQRMRALVCV